MEEILMLGTERKCNTGKLPTNNLSNTVFWHTEFHYTNDA